MRKKVERERERERKRGRERENKTDRDFDRVNNINVLLVRSLVCCCNNYLFT